MHICTLYNKVYLLQTNPGVNGVTCAGNMQEEQM